MSYIIKHMTTPCSPILEREMYFLRLKLTISHQYPALEAIKFWVFSKQPFLFAPIHCEGGICGLAAKRVIKCREFFLRKCHFYKNWIFGKVHRTILKKNFVPNSCNLLVIVSIGVFLEVQFLYSRSKYNTVQPLLNRIHYTHCAGKF